MEHFLVNWGYAALFIATFVASMGIPIGSEIALAYGGRPRQRFRGECRAPLQPGRRDPGRSGRRGSGFHGGVRHRLLRWPDPGRPGREVHPAQPQGPRSGGGLVRPPRWHRRLFRPFDTPRPILRLLCRGPRGDADPRLLCRHHRRERHFRGHTGEHRLQPRIELAVCRAQVQLRRLRGGGAHRAGHRPGVCPPHPEVRGHSRVRGAHSPAARQQATGQRTAGPQAGDVGYRSKPGPPG